MNESRQLLLLVEDSPDDELLSLRAISTCDVPCDVTVVRHGGTALEMLLAPGGPLPDLIVLDFHLPGLNGLEILRAIRKSEKTRHVPVVMLSALESPQEVSDCLSEGANSCVKKPMDPKTYSEHMSMIVRYWLTVHRRPEQNDLPGLAH